MNALEFITEVDNERGDGWQGDLGLLVHKFEEYAAIKVKEALDTSKSLSKFWLKNYVGDDHLCVLCRNEGTIHTEHGSYYCICPNGRDMNKWK